MGLLTGFSIISGVEVVFFILKFFSNFSGKNGSEFSHFLTIRAEGADPPPLTVSLTVKDPFFIISLREAFKNYLADFSAKGILHEFT